MKKGIYLLPVILLAIISCLMCCGDNSGDDDDPGIPSEGLIHCYLFNGNAEDTGSDPKNGTVNGAVLCAGHNNDSNSAYSFSGSSSIDINAAWGFGSCTFSLWIKTAELNGTLINWKELPSGIGTDGLNYRIFNGYITCTYTLSGLGGTDISGTNLHNNDVWTHVVFTIDGLAELQIFVNGAPEKSDSLSTLDINTITEFGSSFTGSVDDICIYNRVLSAEEIGLLYNN
jgi:hypothetical protein